MTTLETEFLTKLQTMPVEKWKHPFGEEYKTPPTFVTFLGNYSVYLSPTKTLNIYLENDLTSPDHIAKLEGPEVGTLYDRVASYRKEKVVVTHDNAFRELIANL